MSQNVSNIVNRGVSRSTVQTNLLDSKLTLFCCNFRYFTILLPAIRSDQSMAGYIDCCFFAVSGYRYLGDGGTHRHEILRDGIYVSWVCLLLFWGWYPKGSPKSKILAL